MTSAGADRFLGLLVQLDNNSGWIEHFAPI